MRQTCFSEARVASPAAGSSERSACFSALFGASLHFEQRFISGWVGGGIVRCQHSATVTAAPALARLRLPKVRPALCGPNGIVALCRVDRHGTARIKARYYLFNQCSLRRVL